MFLFQCCNVRHDFHIKTMFGTSLRPLYTFIFTCMYYRYRTKVNLYTLMTHCFTPYLSQRPLISLVGLGLYWYFSAEAAYTKFIFMGFTKTGDRTHDLLLYNLVLLPLHQRCELIEACHT